MIPDEAIARGSTFAVVLPDPSDASSYAFGTGHAIVSAHYRERGPEVNRVRVLGGGVFDESFDFAAIEAEAERIGQVRDLNLTTSTTTADRAAVELRQAESGSVATSCRSSASTAARSCTTSCR